MGWNALCLRGFEGGMIMPARIIGARRFFKANSAFAISDSVRSGTANSGVILATGFPWSVTITSDPFLIRFMIFFVSVFN